MKETPTLYDPRDYQKQALNNLYAAYRQGINRQLIHLPTGMGKTICALHIPNIYEKRVKRHGMAFLCHRREILFQAYDKFRQIFDGKFWCGIEMGDLHATGMEDIIFISVESMGREYQERINRYAHRKFAYVICDEAHHAIEDSTWDNILTFFGVGSDPDSRFLLDDGTAPLSLFLTATPERSDGVRLSTLSDHVTYTCSIRDGIDWGWLTDIRAWRIHERYNEPEVNFLYKVYNEHAKGENVIFFGSSVAESREFAELLSDYNIPAAHVDAHTEDKVRRQAILDAGSRPNFVLCNRLVFTEGYDNPSITTIIDNGRTESKSRHIQKIGRGLRPHSSARVDRYDTADERKFAIARSPKPFLRYISTFDPTNHSLNVVATISGHDVDPEEDGALIVGEIIDTIEKIQEEMPDRPLHHIDNYSDLQLVVNEVDIWRRTIYNQEAKALTDLNWIFDGNTAHLWMPNNPFCDLLSVKNPNIYRDIPAFISIEDGIITVTSEGGWSQAIRKPVRATSEVIGMTRNMQGTIRKFDNRLKSKFYATHAMCLRRKGKMTGGQEKELKKFGIPFDSKMTAEAAEILIADERIRTKLKKIAA